MPRKTVSKRTPIFPYGSVYAIVLAGGQSRRLYPFNKVLSDLTNDGRTLVQQAYDRATKVFNQGTYRRLIDRDKFFVLTAPAFVSPIRSQLKLPADRFLTDPERRGTWPAILWAMAHVRLRDPDALLAVLTADHLIPDLSAFRRAASQAIDLAASDSRVAMVGVTPTGPTAGWCGFGMFQSPISHSAEKGSPILRFEEKPTPRRAVSMATESGWLWNAGMFFFRIRTAEDALNIYQPEMADIYARLVTALADGDVRKAAAIFGEFPDTVVHPSDHARSVDNTIDYALITPLVRRPQKGLSAWSCRDPLVKWADIGDWTALRRFLKPDARGNVRVGDVKISRDVRDCILAAGLGCRVEVQGIQNKIIAFAGGSALVIPVSRSVEIKDLVAQGRGPVISLDAEALEIVVSKTRLTVRPKT